jgi:hypothetical protein
MTEADTLKAKSKALEAYTDRAERQLVTLAKSLAAQGYSPEEIGQAIKCAGEHLREGAQSVLRQVTIVSLLVSASDG